jgi:hypothetical protein
MKEVFLSYHHEDKKIAAEVKAELEKSGFSAFLAHEDIEVTKIWRNEILKHLDSCSALMAIVTNHFLGSAWVNQEVGAVMAKGKPIVSLIFEGSLTLPGFLEMFQGIHVSSINEAVGKSLATIAKSPESQGLQRLEEWTKQSTSRWQSLVSERLPHEKPSRYAAGIWFVAYSIRGTFHQPNRNELLEILRKIKLGTGWNPWWVPTRPEIMPYPYDGVIECWILDVGQVKPAAYSDFWRASPAGMMFLMRGYEEDSKFTPRTIFDLSTPIWRMGECLSHAARFATALGDESGSVSFQVTWDGLRGRRLASVFNPWRILADIDRAPSKQDSVSSHVDVSANQISSSLPELVKELTNPLYEVFDFYRPSPSLVQEELARFKKSR